MQNTGLLNEDKIISFLNKTPYYKLPKNWQNMVQIMFGAESVTFINKLRKVKACKPINKYIKPDIILQFAGSEKTISIKTGKASNLHTENLETFMKFLLSLGVSKRTIQTILLVHYGDGTLNGTGKVRYDFNQVYCAYRKRILEANVELNASTEVIKKVLDRVIFYGVDEKSRKADFLYFGDEEDGTLISERQIKKYIDRKPGNWDFFENVHIGPIVLRPHARYAHKDIVSEKRRNEIQCNWPNLQGDMQYIEKRYGY